eukprot:Seg4256.2 transcript_id=Seg4256.2/GoldUCD/mRNA.D3Y31 product="hypothetical protein" protein_id=Seg4256.2/GoldUCD/D3Y31
MTSRMTSEYVERLEPEERKQYLSKLTLKSGEQLPDPLALECGWNDNISNLPDLSWRDVTEYLLDSPSVYTKESIKAYKSLEAYNYFTCGHVQDCFHHNISKESEFCYIKSEVLPSQRQGQKTTLYKAWVCLHEKDGWILTGNCTCMAGLGSACSHIAALLFKLEAAVHYNLNEQTASTSQLCAWKTSRKCVTPAPLSAINFSRPKKQSLPPATKKKVPNKHFSCYDPASGSDPIKRDDFDALYHAYPKAAVFTSLPSDEFYKSGPKKRISINLKNDSETDTDCEKETNRIPEPLTSLFDPTAINMTDEELIEHGKKLYNKYCYTNYQKMYENLCEATSEQASNKIWMIHRAGRITASTCYKVSRMQDSKSLLESVMQYKPPFTSKYTEYGKAMEPEACRSFFLEESKNHENFTIYQSGLVIDADFPCLGASPDGIVTCSCHGTGVLEIKCPYKYKDGLIGWSNAKDFPIDETLLVKQNHMYYYQIQLQMELCQVEFGYFYVYANGGGILSMIKLIIAHDSFKANWDQCSGEELSQFFLPQLLSPKVYEALDDLEEETEEQKDEDYEENDSQTQMNDKENLIYTGSEKANITVFLE